MNTLEIIRKEKFMVIGRGVPPEKILDCAAALIRGGVKVFEVTFDPRRSMDDTVKSLKLLKKHFGDELCLGAGTVLNTDAVEAAYDAGVTFIVSPDTSEKVIRRTRELGMVSIPGAYTPNEIVRAYEFGADIVKIFPVLPDQSNYVKVVMSPLAHIPFMITGGVNPGNVVEFLKTGAIVLGAGATVIGADAETTEKQAAAHIAAVREFERNSNG